MSFTMLGLNCLRSERVVLADLNPNTLQICSSPFVLYQGNGNPSATSVFLVFIPSDVMVSLAYAHIPALAFYKVDLRLFFILILLFNSQSIKLLTGSLMAELQF